MDVIFGCQNTSDCCDPACSGMKIATPRQCPCCIQKAATAFVFCFGGGFSLGGGGGGGEGSVCFFWLVVCFLFCFVLVLELIGDICQGMKAIRYAVPASLYL